MNNITCEPESIITLQAADGKITEDDMNELVLNVENWAYERGLYFSKPEKQYLKVSEECGEIAAGLARNDADAVVDAIGDTMVTLIILSMQIDVPIEDCLATAWGQIKDRTGETVNGVFIKSEDLEDVRHEGS
jgi:NTP pyrophosphatase (non-canonical NTP hydrolase)